MRDIRLLVLDLDGTLLDDAKEIPPENVTALEEVRAAGIRVAIATGRMTPTTEPIAERLGIDVAVIAYNGGKVLGPREDGRPLLAHRPVPAAAASELIDFSRERDYLLNYYHDDLLFAEDGPSRRKFMDLYTSRTDSRYRIVDLEELRGTAPTKLIVLAEPEEVDRFLGDLRPRLDGRVFLSRSEPEYLEITAPGVNKGAALPSLASHFGFSVDEIAAIGDADNDVELLETAALGIAVANARGRAKEAADAVTERTNNEGAVAEAVRRYVLRQCENPPV